ncbi:MAG: FAD-dependent oxidoreductase [Gemmatimonadales bacterium]
MREIDVLVVGGGPAGSATAAHAARRGLDVILVDRARFPRHKACAEYLSPEAARDLDALGVRAAVEAAGARRLFGFRLVSDDGASVCGRFEGAHDFMPYRPFGYALPRAVLDSILLSGAREAGVRVLEGAALEKLLVDSNGAVTGAEVLGEEGRVVIRARAVVGADGLNSRVARQLGLMRRGRPERLALVAHLTGMQGLTDMGEMFAARGWYVGFAQVGEGLVNAAMVIPEARGARREWGSGGRREIEGYFLSKLRSVPELARRLVDARIVREVMIAGPFARRARAVVADGALLVGDAADFYDPFTGEGIFAALRGGALAADALHAALAAGGATKQSLHPYVRARRREFLGKWVLERVVGLAATRPMLMRRFTHRLAGRTDVADLWVGAAGDTVPVRALFAPRHLMALVV